MTRMEAFKQKQKEVTDKELYDLAREELSKLCRTGGKSFRMTIPVRVDDTDMIISELLNRFKKLAEL